MKTVPTIRVADSTDTVVLADLPEEIALAMSDIASAAREGLLAMSVAAGMLLAASVLTSALASTQTTILQTARTTLSMGVYKALPDWFAKIHRRYLTPTTSTIAVGVVSILFYILFTLISE